MKAISEITIRVYYREDIEQAIQAIKMRLANNLAQTHFEKWCLEQDKETLKKYEALLAYDNRNYFHIFYRDGNWYLLEDPYLNAFNVTQEHEVITKIVE